MTFHQMNRTVCAILIVAGLGLLKGVTATPIQEARYVTLGGIEQWITIRGDNRANPVLLIVHGGPGDAQSSLRSTYAVYEKDFTVVQWDQRGAGSTYARNPNSPPEPQLVESDGVELAQYLCNYLGKKGIVLLGHSWGSYLAVGMVQRRPELFSAYVGTGQVGSWRANVRTQFDFLLARSRAANDRKRVEQLEAIGTPDPTSATQYFSWWSMRNPYMPSDDSNWFAELRRIAQSDTAVFTEEYMKTLGDGMMFSGRTTVNAMLRTELRPIILTSLMLLLSSSMFAQNTSVWRRVYTLDDSIIEMNTELVSYGGKDIARVRFRWTLRQPETLNGDARQKYKTQLEVIEFICADQRYRPYEVTYFDVVGSPLRKDEMNPPPEWRHPTRANPVMSTLFAAACELINRKSLPPAEPAKVSAPEKVARFALAFSQDLQRTKDFKPVMMRFFARTYLDGYLQDQNTNWFLNLDRATAENASRSELRRFYVAALNANYLTSLYLISRSGTAGSASDRNLIPSDALAFVEHHPYTAKYKRGQSNYDYIAEQIDTVDRMRNYTSLLEGIAALMRKHVISIDAEHSTPYRKIVEDWDWQRDLYQPKERTCADDCFGLPRGTKIYEVNVPILHLQIAEINNELKILSAADYFH